MSGIHTLPPRQQVTFLNWKGQSWFNRTRAWAEFLNQVESSLMCVLLTETVERDWWGISSIVLTSRLAFSAGANPPSTFFKANVVSHSFFSQHTAWHLWCRLSLSSAYLRKNPVWLCASIGTIIAISPCLRMVMKVLPSLLPFPFLSPSSFLPSYYPLFEKKMDVIFIIISIF